MAVIIPHTTRATGTVLTAAIYNADHQTHITNANSLNTELAGVSGVGASTGIIVSNGAGVISGRSLAATNANIAITNGNGVAGNPTIGLANPLPVQIDLANTSGQSSAPIRSRNINAYEFGHSNPAGFGSVLGHYNNSGVPFVAFHGEHGTNNNTIRTRGIAASIIRSDALGGFVFENVVTVNADNQVPTTRLAITVGGNLVWANDGDTWIVRSAADTLQLVTGGIQRLLINNTQGSYNGTFNATTLHAGPGLISSPSISFIDFPGQGFATGSGFITTSISSTEISRWTTSGLHVGKPFLDPGDDGTSVSVANGVQASASNQESGIFNRNGTEGVIVQFRGSNITEGTISESAGTVSYNAFLASHWSQLLDGSKPDILRGTICESLDELNEWPDEDNDRLPKFKISDTPGSSSVYGVFLGWDNDDEFNDAYIAAIGAGWIRIAKGVKVHRGDLIESNGDGCGKVQADNIMRSTTVGKVSSATVTETYEDGSYIVQCTLHCG